MPELHIHRKKQLFAPLNCCFHIFIDDEKMTTLSNGESDRLDIKIGEHTLLIKNNFFKTRKIPFKIDEGEVNKIETSSMPILGWLYFFAPIILIVVMAFKLFHIVIPSYVFLISLIPFIVFIVLILVFSIFKNGIRLKGIE